MEQKVFIDLYSCDCIIHTSKDILANAVMEKNSGFDDSDVESYFSKYVVETRLQNIEHINDDIEKFVAIKTEYGPDGKLSGNDAILFALTKDNLAFLFESFDDEMKNHYQDTFGSMMVDPDTDAFTLMIEVDDMLGSWGDGMIRDEPKPYQVNLYRVMYHA